MKKILVPVDLSIEAYQALEVTSKLAQKLNAWIYLLDTSSTHNEEEKESRIAEWMNSELFRHLNLINLSAEDKTVNGLGELIKEHGIDLAVIGVQKDNLNQTLLGVNLYDLLDELTIPLLVIKDNDLDFWPKKVVFASTFYGEVDTVFYKVKVLSELFKSELHLVKIITPSKFENSSKSIHQLEKFAHQNRLLRYKTATWNHDVIEKGICEYAMHIYADLIVVACHKKSILKKVLSKSIADGVIESSQLPVLCLKIQEETVPKGVIFPE